MQKSHVLLAMVTTIATVLAILVLQPQVVRAQSRSSVRVYQYKLIEIPDAMKKGHLEEWLTERGSEGWEFPPDMVLESVPNDISAVRIVIPGNKGHYMIVRRSM